MKPLSPNLCLIVSFMAVIIAVPVVQLVVEIRRGDTPEVLQIFQQQPTRESLAAFEHSLEETSATARTLRPWMQAGQFLATEQITTKDDSSSTHVLVLGDSFSRIFQTDEPHDAGFIAHLSAALGQPVASLVNDGGSATLVRQELFRRPETLAGKKIVIWEFTERDLRLATEGWQIIPLP